MVMGAGLVLIVQALGRQREARLARTLLEQAQAEKVQEVSTLLEQVKTSFGALSREALAANTDLFLKVAADRLDQQTSRHGEVLEGSRKLIDARLEDVTRRLTELQRVVQAAEKHGAELQGALTTQSQATQRLHETTARLREALANPQRRGQWGERMAEDVLRLAGLVENVNYVKQTRGESGTIPDYTFLLPNQQRLNMDVKFPLPNYLKVLDAPDEATRKACTDQFLRDVRTRINEVTTRAYIDPAQGTVDYVLIFIPNEQIYAFIHEHAPALMDEALHAKVVLCSPLTLYAVLSVIRQAAENFRLQQASRQILELLSDFRQQWARYVEKMERMGKRLEDAWKEYTELVGVRTRQLDRRLDRLDDLRAVQEGTVGEALPGASPPPETAEPPAQA